jgi:guanylate kinase
VTTRAPRPGEAEGRDYSFVSLEQFEAARARGDFLEWAEVHGHLYGTPRRAVEAALEEGRDVILEIDVQGARTVKAAVPEAVTILVSPPSWEVLEKRLRARGTEDEGQVARRLAVARRELAAAGEFDAKVVNDDLEEAIAQVVRILEASRKE